MRTRSSISLPIAAHTHTAGALNLYSAKPDGFADADLAGLRLIAAQATGAIALAQRIADAQEFAGDLETAMRSRSVIDQAIGAIMAQQRCDAEQAFGILRSASQHRNIKLRDLCRDLVTSIGGRPPQDGGVRPGPDRLAPGSRRGRGVRRWWVPLPEQRRTRRGTLAAPSRRPPSGRRTDCCRPWRRVGRRGGDCRAASPAPWP